MQPCLTKSPRGGVTFWHADRRTEKYWTICHLLKRPRILSWKQPPHLPNRMTNTKNRTQCLLPDWRHTSKWSHLAPFKSGRTGAHRFKVYPPSWPTPMQATLCNTPRPTTDSSLFLVSAIHRQTLNVFIMFLSYSWLANLSNKSLQ